MSRWFKGDGFRSLNLTSLKPQSHVCWAVAICWLLAGSTEVGGMSRTCLLSGKHDSKKKIFNGKIIRVIYIYIYIYVVYIHTRNVYYICTYYECICYIYYIAYIMCIYIYTLWLYNMCESIKTDRAADHLWIPKWQISARHRRFWMTRYCWVRSAKSCWEFHSNARAKSQRLSRNYPSIYYIVIL